MSKSSKATSSGSGEESVRVVVRARPLFRRDRGKSVLQVYPDLGQIAVRDPQRGGSGSGATTRFSYDYVLGPRASQLDVYEECVADLVDSAVDGYNATIFAYGQTGSGKTYTMEGESSPVEKQGIVPNALADIFSRLFEAQEAEVISSFLMRVSHVEIYSEEVRDLLSPDPTRSLPVKESKKDGFYVKGLTTTVVEDMESLYSLMERGRSNRTVAATRMNEVSSRSHSIFTVYIETQEEFRDPTGVDERVIEQLRERTNVDEYDSDEDSDSDTFLKPFEKDELLYDVQEELSVLTEATDTDRSVSVLSPPPDDRRSKKKSKKKQKKQQKQQQQQQQQKKKKTKKKKVAKPEPVVRVGKLNLVDLAGSERHDRKSSAKRKAETRKINLSLLSLGHVIKSLASNRKTTHVPYRNSNLTRLLKSSLGGNHRTLMIACISPAESCYEETLSTLRYANQAKQITNKPVINEDPRDALIRGYQEEITRLQEILRAQRMDQLIQISNIPNQRRPRRGSDPLDRRVPGSSGHTSGETTPQIGISLVEAHSPNISRRNTFGGSPEADEHGGLSRNSTGHSSRHLLDTGDGLLLQRRDDAEEEDEEDNDDRYYVEDNADNAGIGNDVYDEFEPDSQDDFDDDDKPPPPPPTRGHADGVVAGNSAFADVREKQRSHERLQSHSFPIDRDDPFYDASTAVGGDDYDDEPPHTEANPRRVNSDDLYYEEFDPMAVSGNKSPTFYVKDDDFYYEDDEENESKADMDEDGEMSSLSTAPPARQGTFHKPRAHPSTGYTTGTYSTPLEHHLSDSTLDDKQSEELHGSSSSASQLHLLANAYNAMDRRDSDTVVSLVDSEIQRSRLAVAERNAVINEQPGKRRHRGRTSETEMQDVRKPAKPELLGHHDYRAGSTYAAVPGQRLSRSSLTMTSLSEFSDTPGNQPIVPRLDIAGIKLNIPAQPAPGARRDMRKSHLPAAISDRDARVSNLPEMLSARGPRRGEGDSTTDKRDRDQGCLAELAELVDGTMPHTNHVLGARGYGLPDFVNYTLRGAGQVVFMNNPLAGFVIMLALFFDDHWRGLCGLIGLVSATLTGLVWGFETNARRSGLYGFNGLLTGLAIGLFASVDNDIRVFIAVAVFASISAILTVALGNAMVPVWRIPPLTLPFNLAAYAFITAAVQSTHLALSPNLVKPAGVPEDIASTPFETVHDSDGGLDAGELALGCLRGVAQIFFGTEWYTGLVILAGMAICSRITAGAALLGSVMGVVGGLALGVPADDIYAGLWSFNPALTLAAVGGMFYLLQRRTVALGIMFALGTVIVQAVIATMLSPYGIAPMTLPFCIATYVSILVAQSMPASFTLVDLHEMTTPEGNLRRHRRRHLATAKGTLRAQLSDDEYDTGSISIDDYGNAALQNL